MHDEPLRYPVVALREFSPAAAGVARSLVLHWSAGDYETVFPTYHFCILGGDVPSVATTADVTGNLRELDAASSGYAAHVAGRNSFAIGVAVMCMRDARPDDFGHFPITPELVESLCVAAARIADAYALPTLPRVIYTHAEAALEDGYFGAGNDERWDIARLHPSRAELSPVQARETGDALRARIAALRA